MADQDAQDRTLPASPRKLQKAREQGQIARSRDFGHFAAIAGIVALVTVAAPWVSGWLRETLATALHFNHEVLQAKGYMQTRLAEISTQMLWLALVPGCVATATAIGAGVAIGGWNFTLQPLAPNFGKLNPLAGMQRLLSKDQLIETLKASGLALALGCIGALYLKSHVESMAGLLAVPLPAAISQAAQTVLGGVLLLLLALGLVAGIDVPLQRHLHAQRLRMSHQEVKQERKESEGSAEVKGRVRQLMREASRRRMMAAVPTADLVVMNPTHYAVALKYEDGSMSAPRVVAKGRRPDRAGDPRPREGVEGAGAAGAGAGARAVCPRRARPRNPRRAVRRGGAGAGPCLPAARRDERPRADARRAARAARAPPELDPHHEAAE